MPRISTDENYPFAGARMKWQNPIEDNFWDPKVWSPNGFAQGGFNRLDDLPIDFIALGVIPNDVIYVCDNDQHIRVARVVFTVHDGFITTFGAFHPGDLTNILYKVGMRAHHTLQSLATIIRERNLYPYTMHWSTLWTAERRQRFDDDENGDIYCIDPPSGGKLNGLKQKWRDDNPGSLEPNPWDSLNPRPPIEEPEQ